MKIQKYQNGGLQRWGSALLDAAEFIPVAGDILGMGRSALKGDWVGMGLSAAGLLPGIGNAATTAKTARKGVKAVVNGAEAWKRIRPAVNAGSVLFGENGAVVPSYGVGSIIRKGADLISDVVRKGSDAIRSASKTADAASSATKTVTPDSISWYNPKTSPRPGTFADEIDNAKDAVYATGSTTVKNPMVTRNPGSGQMVAHNPSSNLPATVEDVATGTKTGNWRQYFGKHGWKYAAAGALGLGLFRNDESSVESETSPESSSNPLRDDWANRNNISFQDSPDSAYDEEATTPATTPAVRPPVTPATPTYVPSETGSSYRIQNGDTLSEIVNDYNAQNGTNYTVDEIAQQNGIADPNKIYVGQSVNFGTAQTTPAQSAPAQTTVPQIEPVQTTAMPGNAIDLSSFNQFFQQSQSNSSAAPANIQSDLTGISDRLANRLDKYNRINRYGNFIKERQEEHPESRYLNRMERRADRRENRAYNRLSRLAAKQGVDFGTNQDESAYINPAVQSQNQTTPTVKPATPTYAGRYGQTIDPWTGKVSYKI